MYRQREIHLAKRHMRLEFDRDTEGFHTETTTQKLMAEVRKGENLVLKGRPNPLQISIIVIEHQGCEKSLD